MNSPDLSQWLEDQEENTQDVQTQNGGKQGKIRRQWLEREDRLILERLLDDKITNTAQGGNKKKVWKPIVDALNDNLPPGQSPRDATSVKHRKDWLRKTYGIISTMVELSGWGWDPFSCRVVQDDASVWDAYIKSKPEAANWRNRSFRLYDLAEELWKGSLATGDGVVTEHAEDVPQWSQRRRQKRQAPMVFTASQDVFGISDETSPTPDSQSTPSHRSERVTRPRSQQRMYQATPSASLVAESVDDFTGAINQLAARSEAALKAQQEGSPRHRRLAQVIRYTSQADWLEHCDRVYLLKYFTNHPDAVATASALDDGPLKHDLLRSWAQDSQQHRG